jgi:hypothetical protein
MAKPEWPGIATAVGILLILTLIAVGLRDDFHLKDWQPLMASMIALGGAAVVYRGAKLAYVAAMAKVDFDRELNQRNEKRKALGLCLRLDFAMNVLRHEAEVLRDSIPDGFVTKSWQVKAAWINLREPEALIEAWNSLESFPPWIAEGLFSIRGNIYDLTQFKDVLGETIWDLNSGELVPPELKRVRITAYNLSGFAKKVRVDLKKLIERLSR